MVTVIKFSLDELPPVQLAHLSLGQRRGFGWAQFFGSDLPDWWRLRAAVRQDRRVVDCGGYDAIGQTAVWIQVYDNENPVPVLHELLVAAGLVSSTDEVVGVDA